MHSVRQKYWQYTSANAKKQKKCKNGFVKCHKLFINLKILNVNIARIANIIQSTITVIASRAGVVVKIVFQMKPVNVANTALNTVKSNFKKPISSLILSLFTKLQYFILCIMVYFAFVKQEVLSSECLTHKGSVKHCIAGEITHQTHCDLDFGYYFYCEESTQEPKQNKNYEEKLQTMKQELELKKAKAVMEPNETNVQDYMEYQKRVLDNSSKFADTWRKVLWKNPDLDYTLKHPTNTTPNTKKLICKGIKLRKRLRN